MLRSASRPSRGFSLLELVVVLTLLAILSAAVAPAFSGTFARVRANNAVRQIVAVMKYAHERALTDTTYYRFYIDTANQAYWLARWTEIDGEWAFIELEDKAAAYAVLPKPYEFGAIRAYQDENDGIHYITFYPSGTCDMDCRIELLTDNDTCVRIETTGKLGKIEVEER